MPLKKFWNLAPDSSKEGVLNMYVYGEIQSSSSFFGSEDDVVASEFVKDLNRYPDTHTINLHINSPGGSVFAAAAIRNQLRKHSATVKTWCDGICASAAVGLLLAADKGYRYMSNASLLMIHNPSTKAQGDQQVFLKTADLLAKVKETILNIYQEGTGLSREQLSVMMDEDTYLDAKESLMYNFVDHVTEDDVTYDFSNESNGRLVCNGIDMDVAATLNIVDLKAHLQQLANKQISAEGGKTFMTFEELMNSLPEDQRTLVQNAISAQVTALTALMAKELQQLKDAKAELTQSVQNLEEQLSKLQKPADNADEDPIKNLPAEAQSIIAQVRAEAVAAQQELAQMKKAEAFATFKATFKEFANLPIQDTHLTALQDLAERDASMFADLRELLKVANTAMGAGFVATGLNTGTDVGSSASAIMDQRARTYQAEHPEADYANALRAVFAEDPELYTSYRNEINRVRPD